MRERACWKLIPLLFVPFLALAGCGDDRNAGSTRPSPTSGEGDVAIWVGGDGDLAVVLTPLSSEPRSALWQSERLSALVDDGRDRSFHRLRIANLGRPGHDVALTSISLSIDLESGHVEWDDLRTSLERDSVKTSSLAYRALSTYEGRILRGGETLDGLVAFVGAVSLADGLSASLEIEGHDLPLTSRNVTSGELRALLEHPTRDLILASLPASERVVFDSAGTPDSDGGVSDRTGEGSPVDR